jgi:hypothetical protein
MGGEGSGEGVGWAERGLWDYLDAGLPVAKSAHNPYTTERARCAMMEKEKAVWLISTLNIARYIFIFKYY